MNPLVRNILKSNVKTHQNMQKSACDFMIEHLDNDNDFEFESIFKFSYDQPVS